MATGAHVGHRENKLLDEFAPQPNAYYQYAMLTRYFPKYSGVLATTVDAPFGPKDRKLVATALRSPKGNVTVLVVNESHHTAAVSIGFDGLGKPVRLQRYALGKEAEDKSSVNLDPQRSFDVSSTLNDLVAPMSIVVYSSYSLSGRDPGLTSE